MSEDRYRVLQDAITKAREGLEPDVVAHHYARSAHLDTLQAILDRHGPNVTGDWCRKCSLYHQTTVRWPCPDVLTVETALRNMGAL